MVNRLLREKPEDHPKFLNGKKFEKNWNPQDFNFFPSKLTDKNSPYGVMLNSLCLCIV